MLTMNSADFDADLAAFAKLVDLAPAIVAKKLTLDIFKDIVEMTPVDTGRARSNWVVSVGKRQFVHLGTIGINGADVQVALAAEILFGYDGKQKIWITNGLPYIERLNEGWSKQAPAGFVESAVFRNLRPIVRVLE